MKPFSPESRASARLKPFPVCGGFFSFSKLLQESAFWFVSLVFFVFAGVSEGCNTPVFRYALEHWPASDYRFVVLTEGKPPQELKQKVEQQFSFSEGAKRPKAQEGNRGKVARGLASA